MIKSLVCGGLGENIRHLVTRGFEIGSLPASLQDVYDLLSTVDGKVNFLYQFGIGRLEKIDNGDRTFTVISYDTSDVELARWTIDKKTLGTEKRTKAVI